jgi:hypothetical protein
VITGHDRAEVGALVCLEAASAHSLGEAEVFSRLRTALASHVDHLHAGGSGVSVAE